MFNNRMLAVAAVLAMAVPALGAAAPIVVPPVPETLVEGHTVFTVIQVAAPGPADGNTTIEERFAAAVAVLVREYDSAGSSYRDEFSRFPGVLWFNDQYLVNPKNTYENNVIDANAYRYPCGGAVMAVNAGDPDPRVTLVSANGADAPTPADYAWLDVSADTAVPSAAASTDAVAGLQYDESYLITDPNDHVWIIDKYTGYSRVGTGGLTTSYAHPVWVVNLLGSPVFVPDVGEGCSPFTDVLSQTTQPVACATGLPVTVGGAVRDDPCAGYMEPSRNGFCYGGQAEAVAPAGCDETAKPKRLYNALLYFKLEDLTVDGGVADHSDPVGSGDTNGCQVGTEWTCPGYDGVDPATGSDDAEGNSHPFHPVAPAHTEREPCQPAGSSYNPYGGTNPTNHGGSTTAAADCDYLHAKRNIDVYFSGSARPVDPVVRAFAVLDLQGSTAPFQDFHSAYPGVTP